MNKLWLAIAAVVVFALPQASAATKLPSGAWGGWIGNHAVKLVLNGDTGYTQVCNDYPGVHHDFKSVSRNSDGVLTLTFPSGHNYTVRVEGKELVGHWNSDYDQSPIDFRQVAPTKKVCSIKYN